LAGPRPGAGAAGCCQAAPPSLATDWPKLVVPRSTLRRTKKGEKCMLQTYVSKCFRCFRGMLQVFQMDIAKVDRDVAYVAMVVHVCCKSLFLMFHLCFGRVLQVSLSGCYICFTLMLQVFYLDVTYVCNGFQAFFRCFFQVFSEACFKCFIDFQMYVASVCIWMF
jgi:hypothetical protein